MTEHLTPEIIERLRLADSLVASCEAVLAEHPPEIVGAALGQLVAILVAGHHPAMRDQVLDMLVSMTRDLVPIAVEELIDAGRCGADWRGARAGATLQ